MTCSRSILGFAVAIFCLSAAAASTDTSGRAQPRTEFPAPVEGDFVARDFRFGTGETLPSLNAALPDDRHAAPRRRRASCATRC